MKKPLKLVPPVYSISETALAAEGMHTLENLL
jgi:hypothetical protein